MTLMNPKHERFAHEIAKGASGREAYRSAGYACTTDDTTDAAASRLLSDVRVRERIAEIQERAARRSEITISRITARLLAIATKGETSNEASMLAVACASLMDAAKLNGLVVDKTEAKTENVTKLLSDKPMSEEEWAEAHGADLGRAA